MSCASHNGPAATCEFLTEQTGFSITHDDWHSLRDATAAEMGVDALPKDKAGEMIQYLTADAFARTFTDDEAAIAAFRDKFCAAEETRGTVAVLRQVAGHGLPDSVTQRPRRGAAPTQCPACRRFIGKLAHDCPSANADQPTANALDAVIDEHVNLDAVVEEIESGQMYDSMFADVAREHGVDRADLEEAVRARLRTMTRPGLDGKPVNAAQALEFVQANEDRGVFSVQDVDDLLVYDAWMPNAYDTNDVWMADSLDCDVVAHEGFTADQMASALALVYSGGQTNNPRHSWAFTGEPVSTRGLEWAIDCHEIGGPHSALTEYIIDNTSNDVYADLDSDFHWQLSRVNPLRAASVPTMPAETLDDIAREGDPYAQLEVARNENASTDTLLFLATSDDADVTRQALSALNDRRSVEEWTPEQESQFIVATALS